MFAEDFLYYASESDFIKLMLVHSERANHDIILLYVDSLALIIQMSINLGFLQMNAAACISACMADLI